MIIRWGCLFQFFIFLLLFTVSIGYSILQMEVHPPTITAISYWPLATTLIHNSMDFILFLTWFYQPLQFYLTKSAIKRRFCSFFSTQRQFKLDSGHGIYDIQLPLRSIRILISSRHHVVKHAPVMGVLFTTCNAMHCPVSNEPRKLVLCNLFMFWLYA